MLRFSQIRRFSGTGDAGCIVALGTFDGVHTGHAALITAAAAAAAGSGLDAAVFSFTEPPAAVLAPDSFCGILTEVSEKSRVMQSLGADIAYFADFADLRSLTAEAFIGVLVNQLGAKGAVCGCNYTFGAGKAGTPDMLRSVFGDKLTVIPPVMKDGVCVSSSEIRQLVLKGDVGRAAELLGRNYSVTERVVSGKRLGRTLGFPTANIIPSEKKVRPAPGVYATLCTLPDGRRLPAVTDAGYAPSVEAAGGYRLETHIPGFSGDLYTKQISVGFCKRLRGEERFSSVQELKERIALDIAETERYFSEYEQ